MQQLNKKTTDISKSLPLKVMQFGGGNFLRAFVDWMIDILNEQTDFNAGIAIIKPTERGDYSELKAQDGLFTVILDGIQNGQLVSEKRLVTAVQKVINPYTEWEKYLELAKDSDLRFVVSNTTEAGIKFSAADDLNDTPPKEFPAKLAIWLHLRYAHFGGDNTKGCVFLPCELIATNGAALREAILAYADHWNLSTDFKDWIHTANHFCNTLVDRIVSGYPSEIEDKTQSELGYEDKLIVAGEQYHSWVIQAPQTVQNELPFDQTDLNVQFVDDLAPYREMKVRFLNGAHTAMVPVAYLAGLRLVKEAMDNEEISCFVESLLLEETSLTLDFPDTVKQKFVQDVLDRFRNPTLKHKLISISLNSTSKFVARLLPTLRDYRNTQGKLPRRIVFSLAALILFYKGEFEGNPIDMKDKPEIIDLFGDVWAKFDSNAINRTVMVQYILGQADIWGEDMGKIHGLTEMLAAYLEAIENKGILTTVKQLKQE